MTNSLDITTLEDALDTVTAASLIKCTPRTVRNLIRDGRLAGVTLAGRLYTSRKALAAYRPQSRRGRGRPQVSFTILAA